LFSNPACEKCSTNPICCLFWRLSLTCRNLTQNIVEPTRLSTSGSVLCNMVVSVVMYWSCKATFVHRLSFLVSGYQLVSMCFAVLRQLRSICHSVPATTFQTLIISLVLSRLDYGNAVLAGLPAYLFRRLQSVMNVAAWLIYGLRHSDHISNALISLHWLRAQEGVWFKMAVPMYKATHGTALSYPSQLVRVSNLPGWHSLHSVRTSHPLVSSIKLSAVGVQAFQVGGQCDLCSNSVDFSSVSENISVPGLIS